MDSIDGGEGVERERERERDRERERREIESERERERVCERDNIGDNWSIRLKSSTSVIKRKPLEVLYLYC